MGFIEGIYEKARKEQKTIVLPESTEERNLKAMKQIHGESLAKIVLVGNKEDIARAAKENDVSLDNVVIRDPSADTSYDEFVSTLVDMRKNKGMTEDKAKDLVKDPLFFAALMVKLGQADAYVSGATHSTGDVLRPALQIIKTAPGCKTVSSFFIMILPEESPYSKIRTEIFFADCAVVPSPDAEQMADIAISTAQSFRSLVQHEEPRVAMLSFSTKGSAQHEHVDRVLEATAIVKEKDPSLLVDGELQADAALIKKVGDQKSPGSPVAGQANILIFPDLNSGNIGYKLVQRLAGAMAVGPIVQGLDKPVNDLSRGCSVQDIVDTVAVTACQAG